MIFSQRVVSITQDEILPKVFDNFLSDNFATFRFISNGEMWNGETLKRPVKLGKNTHGGSFSGTDTFSTDAADTRQTMSYDVRGYEIPIAIPGMERAVNQTDAQVLNLVKVELESTQEDALDDVGDMIYGDGTGNSGKDFNGFGNLIDNGTTAALVGNLSRTTYPTLKGTRTATGGTFTFQKLSTLLSAVSAGSAARQRPTLLVSNETVWDLGESLFTPTVQANYEANGYPVVTRKSRGVIREASLRGAQGFVSIVYRGIPWVADEKSTSQTLWAINEEYIQWYGLKDRELKQVDLGAGENIDGVYSDIPSENTGLQWSGFLKPTNQYGDVGHVYLLGNLVTFQPRRHGRLTGITGV